MTTSSLLEKFFICSVCICFVTWFPIGPVLPQQLYIIWLVCHSCNHIVVLYKTISWEVGSSAPHSAPSCLSGAASLPLQKGFPCLSLCCFLELVLQFWETRTSILDTELAGCYESSLTSFLEVLISFPIPLPGWCRTTFLRLFSAPATYRSTLNFYELSTFRYAIFSFFSSGNWTQNLVLIRQPWDDPFRFHI